MDSNDTTAEEETKGEKESDEKKPQPKKRKEAPFSKPMNRETV